MPNHVSTNLVVKGPSQDVQRFVNAVDKGDKDGHFQFSGLLPMPDELRGTRCPVRIQTQEEIDKMWAEWNRRKDANDLKEWEIKENRPFDLGITREQSDALIAKYGTNNWYDWALNNWGTKWGAYDASDWDIDENKNAMSARVSYSTAWSPASDFFLNVSPQFPTLTFTTEYADEGGGFVNETVYCNGEVVVNNKYDWDSDVGIEIRNNVGYGPSEDEEY